MPDARYLYLGDGSEFHFGIPARDLTDEEYAALSPEEQATVKASRLYQAPPKAKEAAKQDAKAAPAA